MFTSFFYLLRARGVPVSLDEWMTLMEALKQGLHGMTLMGFYSTCRAVLVKSEARYDDFDGAFLEFFGEIAKNTRELPPELLEWLNGPELEALDHLEQFQRLMEQNGLSMEEVLKRFEERLKDQDAEHNGGSKWIGRDGFSPFGNNGRRLGGIRVGGQSRNRSAFLVASERRFRDFRQDNTLDIRQFQMAFRRLRQLSVQAEPDRTELDVDATIRETGENAGRLKVVYQRPRKNNIKVLLLMDSGGSMDYYAGLCSQLFQAAERSNTFKDLKVYYFHNCIYERLHLEPTLFDIGEDTESVLSNLDSEYRVIVVGDAMMAPEELYYPKYDWRARSYGKQAGIEFLEQFKNRYPHIIWLNPQPRAELYSYWATTYDELAKIFDMYDLTVDGLERGIERLLVRY